MAAARACAARQHSLPSPAGSAGRGGRGGAGISGSGSARRPRQGGRRRRWSPRAERAARSGARRGRGRRRAAAAFVPGGAGGGAGCPPPSEQVQAPLPPPPRRGCRTRRWRPSGGYWTNPAKYKPRPGPGTNAPPGTGHPALHSQTSPPPPPFQTPCGQTDRQPQDGSGEPAGLRGALGGLPGAHPRQQEDDAQGRSQRGRAGPGGPRAAEPAPRPRQAPRRPQGRRPPRGAAAQESH